MRLNEIKDNAGAKKTRVRIGRGIGSGMGKMGGRGGKGQTARTGVAIGGFEGGQMPLYRRLPKRGFNKWRRKTFNEVTLAALQRAVEEGKLKAGQSVDVGVLVETGVLRRPMDGLRVLATGELRTALKLVVDHATVGARAAIENAGGSVSVIEKKVLEADEMKRAKTAAKKEAKKKS
ncbi:MAG: 50S ribosomal protein L15 [Hyphomicrobiaceae bacterium]|nr:50S ribosomal protein L15 [Hyphomicrobiaceae bacterium]